MPNWNMISREWERSIKDILSEIPEDYLSPAEQQVLTTGLVLPMSQVERKFAADALHNLALIAEPDHVDFLTDVGAIHLICMGADDGFLLPASEIAPLEVYTPSIYESLLDGADATSISRYLMTSYSDEALGMIPREVLESAVALSSVAGSKVYAATKVESSNDYLRISIHGESIRYASFEEFLVTEIDLMLEALRSSAEERITP